MKSFIGQEKTEIDLKEFETFDYRDYLGKIGVNTFEFKKNLLHNLPPEAVILKASGKAFAVLTKRIWDQDILGFNTYSIDDIYIKRDLRDDYEVMDKLIKTITDYSINNSIKLLTFRFSAGKMKYLQLFEKNGFITTDILSTFLFDKKSLSLKADDVNGIRPAAEKDHNEILKISSDSFEFSRIYMDNNIPKSKADRFYFELTKSILSDRDNLKLVIEKQNKIAGFVIGNKANNINMFFEKKLGYLWLISVLKSFRGKNIAKALLNEFLIKFSEEVDYIEISTQIANVPAINLYSSFGLHPVTYIITMHYWNKQ